MKTNEKKELHTKTNEELKKMLADKRKELTDAKISNTRGKLKNVSSLTNIRIDIARILTIIRGKELSENVKNA